MSYHTPGYPYPGAAAAAPGGYNPALAAQGYGAINVTAQMGQLDLNGAAGGAAGGASANAEPEIPSCVACAEYQAWYDPSRNCYSKYCSLECQKEYEDYTTAMTTIKDMIAKKPNLAFHDLPPPTCLTCGFYQCVFDTARKKYLEGCGFCEGMFPVGYGGAPGQQPQQPQQPQQAMYTPQPVGGLTSAGNNWYAQQQPQVQAQPAQPYRPQPVGGPAAAAAAAPSPAPAPAPAPVPAPAPAPAPVPQFQVAPSIRPTVSGTRPGVLRQTRRPAPTRKNPNAPAPIPSDAASRVAYNPPQAAGRGNLCAHCYQSPSSPSTNMSLFCDSNCEKLESKMLGAAVLVVSADFKRVALGKMPDGPYANLFSVLFSQKKPKELARDSCIRIAKEQTRDRITVMATHPYRLFQHSTADVYSYVVLVPVKNMDGVLPVTGTMGRGAGGVQVCHFDITVFTALPATTGNLQVHDMDGEVRTVSRMTAQLIREWFGNTRR
ncbi:hypothetical protein HK102_008916 [Quaeritorhiza haematococci]|nr:hypothetical protein HK102_008916 [Quaeritorhiza haematococci]